MSTQAALPDDPLQLIKLFTQALLANDGAGSKPIVAKMVNVALKDHTATVKISPQLEPEIRHKPKVMALMDLARKFRHATAENYDASYKELQNALYEVLQHTP